MTLSVAIGVWDEAAFNRGLPSMKAPQSIATLLDPSHVAKAVFNAAQNWVLQLDALEAVVSLMTMAGSPVDR